MNLRDYLLQMVNTYDEAKKQPFGGHPLKQMFTKELPAYLREILHFKDSIKIKGSTGTVNWAFIPWLAFMDSTETTTTKKGTYVVYLFSEDMQNLYLAVMVGIDLDTSKSPGEREIQAKEIRQLRSFIATLRREQKLDILNITETARFGNSPYAKNYTDGIAGFVLYNTTNLPPEHVLLNDLKAVLAIYEKYISNKHLNRKNQTEENRPAEKKIPQETSRDTQAIQDPQTIRDVRAIIDHIAGFIASRGFTYSKEEISNFYLSLKSKPFVILAGISGTGKSKLAELFAEAVGSTRENGRFTLIPVRPDWNDSTDLLGYRDIEQNFLPGPLTKVIEAATANPDHPYFVCLDEMNLSRVEYYFSDYLSLIESRKRVNGRVHTGYIINETYLSNPRDLARYSQLMIPENLYITGTVNMDETTHPFSKKVLDRANTLEFSTATLDLYPQPGVTPPAPLSPGNGFLQTGFLTLQECLPKYQATVEATVNKLAEINRILQKANLHIGYRVRDEICFYLIHSTETGLLSPEQAFDNQLLQKILPRIQGSSLSIKRALTELFKVCTGQDLTNEDGDLGELMMEKAGKPDVKPYPRCAAKIAQMVGRFEEDGFTSFWL